MNEKVKEIKERHNRATPGPWKWLVNEYCHNAKLVTVHSGQYYVMGFKRWGMHDAQPTFQKYERCSGPVTERGSMGMRKASEMLRFNQDYRHDDGWIDHPDADCIAHAWEDVDILLAEIERLQTYVYELKDEIVCEAKTAYAEDGCAYHIEATGSEAERVTQLLRNESIGLVDIRPCNVGDEVYFIHQNSVKKGVVVRFAKTKDNFLMRIGRGATCYEDISVRMFGKWIFENEQQAIYVLEGLREGGECFPACPYWFHAQCGAGAGNCNETHCKVHRERLKEVECLQIKNSRTSNDYEEEIL